MRMSHRHKRLALCKCVRTVVTTLALFGLIAGFVTACGPLEGNNPPPAQNTEELIAQAVAATLEIAKPLISPSTQGRVVNLPGHSRLSYPVIPAKAGIQNCRLSQNDVVIETPGFPLSRE